MVHYNWLLFLIIFLLLIIYLTYYHLIRQVKLIFYDYLMESHQSHRLFQLINLRIGNGQSTTTNQAQESNPTLSRTNLPILQTCPPITPYQERYLYFSLKCYLQIHSATSLVYSSYLSKYLSLFFHLDLCLQ